MTGVAAEPAEGERRAVAQAAARRQRLPGRLGAVLCAFALAGQAAAQPPGTSLADLTLEQLGEIEITSVSKRGEPLSGAASSIFVITADDIRRSGARTLPEALRLAPNLQVARVNATAYAISARGFNFTASNKMLVLIDGRTVYTPLLSGVFWDQQSVLMEDVERIEVISGPGATLWGANAVNGVINVITRAARDTQGTLLTAGLGNRDHGAAVRYGARLGERGHIRFYGKRAELQNTITAAGGSLPDGWQMGQAGFRADWRVSQDEFTLQGDAYSGKSETFVDVGVVFPPIKVSGENLLARWTRRYADGSDVRLQAYIDRFDRDDPLFYRPEAQILDVEFQHGLPLGAHRLTWGGGYRRGDDDIRPGIAVTAFVPPSARLEWANIFVQNEFRLSPSLAFTAGLKLESNDYTGWEYLPSARLAWRPDDHRLVWGAVSRAVRAPSRLDRDVRFPANPPFLLLGGAHFESEVARVYELGYRSSALKRLNWSVTAFRHDWDRVRSGTAVVLVPVLQPSVLENRIEGFVQGVEAWATAEPVRGWRLSGGALFLTVKLGTEPGSTDPFGAANPQLANDPDQQWLLRSSHDLPGRQELDVFVRRVGSLPLEDVPGYTAVDARWGWRVSRDFEVSLALQNLFDRRHPEFGALPNRSEFGRSAFLKLLWTL